MTDNILDAFTTPGQTPTGLPKKHGRARSAVPLAVAVEPLARPGGTRRKNGKTEREQRKLEVAGGRDPVSQYSSQAL